MQKRYLVYKNWNGRVHTSIEYGELTNGEGRAKPDPTEIQRYEIKSTETDLKELKRLYPRTIMMECDELPYDYI